MWWLMNLFAELLSTTQGTKPQVTSTGPRIQKRRGVEIKSAREVKIMRQASAIVATVLKEVMAMVEPGQTTGDLDAFAERRIREMGATPSFKGYTTARLDSKWAGTGTSHHGLLALFVDCPNEQLGV